MKMRLLLSCAAAVALVPLATAFDATSPSIVARQEIPDETDLPLPAQTFDPNPTSCAFQDEMMAHIFSVPPMSEDLSKAYQSYLVEQLKSCRATSNDTDEGQCSSVYEKAACAFPSVVAKDLQMEYSIYSYHLSKWWSKYGAEIQEHKTRCAREWEHQFGSKIGPEGFEWARSLVDCYNEVGSHLGALVFAGTDVTTTFGLLPTATYPALPGVNGVNGPIINSDHGRAVPLASASLVSALLILVWYL